MKKFILGFALIAGLNSAQAQIADGSVAPDFTATDLNGVSHTLSTYLNAGKTVILDISATWCGPCWNYHNTHALADMYNSYGPNGSDEVMIFYIEGDASTSIADLHGTGTNTQGDWVTGTPYPIINSSTVADLYQIGYFPTIYRICPDGFVYEIGQLTASALRSNINAACGSTLSGVTNHGATIGSEIALCSSSAAPTAEIKNYGTNSITSATVVLKENGVQVATTNYSGSLAQWTEGTVTFPSMAINPSSTYTVEVTAINGGAPVNNFLTTDDMSVVAAASSAFDITVKVFTDNYPSETTWEIRNSSTNALVASGGPYVGAGGTAAGGPDALTTKTHSVTLPAGTNCYKIIMTDSYGDGFGYGTNPAGQYGIAIFNGTTEILNLDLTGFGPYTANTPKSLTRDAAFLTGSAVGIEESVSGTFSVYPNPSTDMTTVEFSLDETANVSVVVLNSLGQTVYANNLGDVNGAQKVQVNTSDLEAGIYLVQITVNGVVTTKRLSVIK
jgi:hypothetical protein